MNRQQIFIGILLILSAIAFSNVIYNRGGNVRFSNTSSSFNPSMNQSVLAEYPSASLEERVSVSSENLKGLILLNHYGDVKIVGYDNLDIEIATVVTVYANTEQLALEHLAKLELDHQINQEHLSLSMENIPRSTSMIRGVQTDFVIHLPQDLFVSLTASHGFVHIENLASGLEGTLNHLTGLTIKAINNNVRLSINHSSGDIRGVNGTLQLDTAHSQLTVEEVAGDLRLNSRHSRVHLDDISGEVNLQASHDHIDLRDIGGTIQGDFSHSNLHTNRVAGNMDLNARFGSLRLANVSNELTIRSRHTTVDIELQDSTDGYNLMVDAERASVNSNVTMVKETISNSRDRYLATHNQGVHLVRLDAEYGNVSLRIR